MIHQLIDLFLHLDKHLSQVVLDYGVWSYLILFIIIFCETGLVVTPFLPGDSLLFAAGAIAAVGNLNVWAMFGLLAAAAILGDTVNYWIGKYFGLKAFEKFVNPQHIEKTHGFFEKYGAKTIVIARFVPIIRTFAPFIAGVGKMTYLKFFSYNVVGGILWITLFIFGGYFFGNIPVVKRNFSLVILVIIILSIMPAVIEIIREKRRTKTPSQTK